MHYMYINYCTYPSPLLYIIVHTLVHYCTLIIVHTLVHCCTLIIVHTLVHYLTQAPRVCMYVYAVLQWKRLFCVLFYSFHCSNVVDGVPQADATQSAFLLSRTVDPNTNITYVTFTRPLDTSDVDDVVLDRPLYLHFGYSPDMDINSPRTSRWTSRSPIQFDCNRDGKNTLQPCCAVVCIVHCTLTAV